MIKNWIKFNEGQLDMFSGTLRKVKSFRFQYNN